MQKIIIILMMINPFCGIRASTFFIPDSDTASLIMLVSNTASTVSNTLKILEVAKKTSDQIDKYNFIAMRRYFIARRIKQHALDIAEASKMKAKDLRELNQQMLRLKINLKGLKSNINSMVKDLYNTNDFLDRHREKIANSFEDEKEAHSQEVLSASEGSMSKHVQNTAMNTALTSKIISKIRRDSLDYQKTDLAMKRTENLKNIRKDQFYRDWIGLKSQDI